MEKTFGNFNRDLEAYVKNTFHPEDSILKEVRERSIKEGLPAIQVGSMDALHLEVLTRSFGVKKAVEIGTLGGYSGIAIARGLHPGGKLYTFELEPHNAKVAKESFLKAKVDRQVEVFVGRASEKLAEIESHGPFDLVFMDADKQGYVTYLDWAAKHLKVGGVVLADNTFAWGNITKKVTAADNPDVAALQAFNKAISNHPQFRATILPTGEGLTFAVRLP